jgi:hypothetical protein
MSGMSDEPYEQQIILARRRLKAPRAAAVSGILFAVLYGSGMTLLALSIPPFAIADNIWIETSGNTVSLALLMVPYSGIAFLWFIGVIRDHLGDAEDRLFSSVFLGSGLLFMALTFLAAAFIGGLLSSYALMSSALIDSGVFLYARSVVYQVLNLYAIRMAGVFMISLGTIWLRTGVLARGWTILTYALALVLLLSISLSLWVILIFPAWVLIISVRLLIQNLRDHPEGAPGES